MIIDRDLILKIESLSKLELTSEERTIIKNDLNNILSMITKLEELDLEGIDPLIYVSEDNLPLREDKIDNQVEMNVALSNAKHKKEPYFKVPKVIEQ